VGAYYIPREIAKDVALSRPNFRPPARRSRGRQY
jgi:hypothetical protein